MADLTKTDKKIRYIEVEGDKDSDAMAAAVHHIMLKTGCDTWYRYIVKGPNYSCALESIADKWVIVDYDDREPAPQAVLDYHSLGVEREPLDAILYKEPGR